MFSVDSLLEMRHFIPHDFSPRFVKFLLIWYLCGTFLRFSGWMHAMPKMKMVARKIDAMSPPEEGQTDYWDVSLSGFGLRVAASGRKTWIVMYRHQGRKRRMTLGTYPSLGVADARDQAKTVLHEVAHDKDPAGEKQAARKAESFAELAHEYIERHAKPNKRSWFKDQSILDRDLLPRFGHRKAAEISRRDILALMDEIVERGAPIAANRTLEIVRKIFNWGISRDIVEFNPCHGVKKPSQERQRDRVLADSEIAVFWTGLENAAMSPLTRLALKFQLATAQRKGEVAGAKWDEFDLDGAVWTIPAIRVKNRLTHRVPLSSLALGLLEQIRIIGGASAFLFPSPRAGQPMTAPAINHALHKNRAVFAMPTFVPHDLRRTAASHMASMGISRLTIGKVLNHAEQGVTATYDRHGYDQEKRHALDAWGRRLEEIIGARPVDVAANVVRLPQGG